MRMDTHSGNLTMTSFQTLLRKSFHQATALFHLLTDVMSLESMSLPSIVLWRSQVTSTSEVSGTWEVLTSYQIWVLTKTLSTTSIRSLIQRTRMTGKSYVTISLCLREVRVMQSSREKRSILSQSFAKLILFIHFLNFILNELLIMLLTIWSLRENSFVVDRLWAHLLRMLHSRSKSERRRYLHLPYWWNILWETVSVQNK